MVTPAPAPAPAPVPTSAPSSGPPPLAPGYTTTEAWITFITMVIGAIPSSGLVANAPVAAQVVGLVAGVLAAWRYSAQRTNLKIAHVQAHAMMASAAAANSNVAAPARAAQAGFIRGRVMAVLAGIGLAIFACAAGTKWTNSFVGCEKADFGKMVNLGSGSGSDAVTEDVLRAVEDLILKNAADLETELAALVIQSSLITIDCAITATEDLLASQIAAGSGSGAGSAPAGSGSATVAATAQLRARAITAYPGLGRALAWAAAHPAK